MPVVDGCFGFFPVGQGLFYGRNITANGNLSFTFVYLSTCELFALRQRPGKQIPQTRLTERGVLLRQISPPFELFMKNKQFDDQHENRLVLNIKDDEKRKHLLNNTIDIGPLDDICVFDDFYHGGGMSIFVELEV